MSETGEGLHEVIIIGAGVMGSATAYYLSKELGAKVLLLEQFDFLHRKGSSHGESRIIRRTYPQEHYTYLMKDAYQLWAEAEIDHGTKVFTKTGGIDFSRSDDADVQSLIKSGKKYNIPLEILSADEVTNRFPTVKLSKDLIGVYSPDAGTLNATKAVAMFQSLAKRNNCKLLDNTTVTKIEELKSKDGQNNFTIVQTNTGKILLTKKLIVTAGAWTKKLLTEEVDIPLNPVKTTTAYWKVEDSSAYSYEKFPVFINYGDPTVYGCPAHEYPNMIKCSAHGGPPCDPDTRDFDPNEAGLADVRRFLETNFTGVELRPTLTESCMYTLSPDQGFIIDNIPTSTNILLGCGFSGHGFKLAPIVGKILSQLVLTGEHPYPTIQQHFRLSRFEKLNPVKSKI